MRTQRDSSAGIIADELEAERDMVREVRRVAQTEALREAYDRMCADPDTGKPRDSPLALRMLICVLDMIKEAERGELKLGAKGPT